jgi:hypothetical protein
MRPVSIFGLSVITLSFDDAAEDYFGLALSSVLFLIWSYTTFIALRTQNPELASRLEFVVDILLSLALTCMVISGLVLVYAVW